MACWELVTLRGVVEVFVGVGFVVTASEFVASGFGLLFVGFERGRFWRNWLW